MPPAARASEVFAPNLLHGHVAIVTGGGTNLGRAAAAELIACGAEVVIAGRRRDVLERTASELGAQCSCVSGDIRVTADCERIVDVALERHGRVHMLLNNAGGQYFSAAEAITEKGWAAVMRLNVDGTLGMTRACVERALRPGGGGMIASVTVSPHGGFPGMAHSGAARAAVEAMTRGWAARGEAEGISAVTLALGRFDTESLRKYPEELTRGLARSVPLGRLGAPSEFGWLAVLIASPLGHALSGSTITLDGAADNWWGPWPPPALTDDAGTVPIEERRGR
ncbi:MAG TPA: SDR family oxidoreductase [Solirubrobacteraceae bacterium]|nr:SDR family oxidoreductase [Solirubrobacteraceae bacterium]